MVKIMVFIDGTWLYSNLGKLGEIKGKPDYHIDFGKLPRVLSGEIAQALARKQGAPFSPAPSPLTVPRTQSARADKLGE